MIVGCWNAEQALRRLDQQCKQSLKTGYRPNTIRNYKSRANIYIRFCQLYDLYPFPTTEWNLVRFARYLANGITSYDTVKNYLSAVKRFHELGKIQFPSQLSILKVEMMSIKRELAGPVHKAKRLTLEILLEIYQKVNLKSSMEILAYIALLIGFYMFLRCSNLVPETAETFNPKEQLTRKDVSKMGKLTVIDIKWSKTNQFRERDLIIPLLPAKHRVICPIFWMEVLFQRFPVKKQDAPLFSFEVRGKVIPLTVDYLSKKYKEWVKAHRSFRAGFYLAWVMQRRSEPCINCGFVRGGYYADGGLGQQCIFAVHRFVP